MLPAAGGGGRCGAAISSSKAFSTNRTIFGVLKDAAITAQPFFSTQSSAGLAAHRSSSTAEDEEGSDDDEFDGWVGDDDDSGTDDEEEKSVTREAHKKPTEYFTA